MIRHQELRDGVLYAAEFEPGRPARPVRVVDRREWISYTRSDLSGFDWTLDYLVAPRTRLSVGVACLYWAPVPDSPAPEALLDMPWEPLPQGWSLAAQEMTRRADANQQRAREASGSWLCLRPVSQHHIVGPWADYNFERLQKERRLEQRRRLLGWDEVNRRLTALHLRPVDPDRSGYTAEVSLDQITALLDRAETAEL